MLLHARRNGCGGVPLERECLLTVDDHLSPSFSFFLPLPLPLPRTVADHVRAADQLGFQAAAALDARLQEGEGCLKRDDTTRVRCRFEIQGGGGQRLMEEGGTPRCWWARLRPPTYSIVARNHTHSHTHTRLARGRASWSTQPRVLPAPN